jgi:predicted dehydrogenase
MSIKNSVSRRGFLQAAAASILPFFLESGSRAGAKSIPPSGRITVGMIGLGRQAYQINVKQFLAMPDVQVVAVCDVDSWRLANARQLVEAAYAKNRPSGTYKGCDAHVDFRDLLARKDIDAVMISTPDHWHVPMALAAFEAGKDVSLEKPITRTIAEGRRLAAMATKHQRIFRVDSEFRSNPRFHTAATLIRNGLLGKILRVTVGVPKGDVGCKPPNMPVPPDLEYERWQGPAPRAPYTEYRVHKPRAYERPGWMRHLYYCDGMLTNWGTHLNDVAMWAADLDRTGPVEIEATGVYPPRDSFWNVLLSFEIKYRFKNGIEWIYRTDKPFYRMEGTEGSLFVDGREIRTEPASLLQVRPDRETIRFRLKSDKQDFIDCVKSREETLEPAEVGHRVTSLGHLGHIAIQLNTQLRWDPDKECFIGNDAANALRDRPIHTPRYS